MIVFSFWSLGWKGMHLLTVWNVDRNCLFFTKPFYVVFACHFASKLVPIETCCHCSYHYYYEWRRSFHYKLIVSLALESSQILKMHEIFWIAAPFGRSFISNKLDILLCFSNRDLKERCFTKCCFLNNIRIEYVNFLFPGQLVKMPNVYQVFRKATQINLESIDLCSFSILLGMKNLLQSLWKNITNVDTLHKSK